MSNPKSNFNAALILNVAGAKAIKNDPNFGAKIHDALMGGLTGTEEDRIITVTHKEKEIPVGKVIVCHQADQSRVVATGNDTGVDLGAAGGTENLKPENVRQLFEAATANFGLVVRQEAVRKPKEEGGAATEPTAGAAPSTEGSTPAAS